MKPLRVLAIDDQPGILAALEAELAGAGHKALTAGSGDRGLCLAQSERPDVILLDIRMPGMDGLQVLRVLKAGAETAAIPVILLTGQQDLEPLRRGFALGADDYLRKPFNSVELQARIGHQARLKEAGDALRQARDGLEVQVQERTAELDVTMKRLQALAHQLIEVQEAERRRVAIELHDEIGQAMTAVRVNLQAALRLQDPLAVRCQLQESVILIDQGIEHVRQLLVDLRPPLLDDMGLVNALQMYVEQQARRSGWQARCDFRLAAAPLPANLELTCFRVVQEALTNAARHAQARQVGVELRQEDAVLNLIVWDDGIGFDSRAARRQTTGGSHLGLLGMQERVSLAGGLLELDSAPSRGTEIRVRLPLASGGDGVP